ncbi:unnamed protein product [Psylliodes chrysocephalus]|uniref:Stimulator of interferon genes protein n=1 Tax=Psylliodes chrysocephalus TaxID=3402493 RepID=A0A9P0CRF8_9CUCU|nr:unnamed protein product [Psylliodes chrysocephala]
MTNEMRREDKCDNTLTEDKSDVNPKEKINYRRLCVRKRKGFYPNSIPKERGCNAKYISICISLLLFIGDWFTNSSSFAACFMHYTSGIIFSIILQLIYRVVLISEEGRHLESRYDGKIKKLLKDAFHFNFHIWLVFFVCTLYCISYYIMHGLPFTIINVQRLVLASISIYLLGKVLKLSDSPLNDSLWVAEDNGLDYGSGMAYSFFHGYLNYVLPNTGGEDKNLKEIMTDFESKNGIKFEVYKLFILVPKSMRCPVSLENEYSPSIQESRSLEEKIKTVAGVRNRVYKNAVYKIVSKNGNRLYVSAEYATPLKTFANVCNARGVHAESYEKLKMDIISKFYLTLIRILDDNGLNELCEVIYFEDSYKNSNGELCYYDVGEIIRSRIKELKKQKND